VFDRPIIPGSNREMVINSDPPQYVNMSGGDVRTILRNQAQMGPNATTVEYIAKGCALAESLIVNGYSSTVMFTEYSFQNLIYPELRMISDNSLVGTNVRSIYQFDQHTDGGMMSLVLTSLLYHIVLSCVYELVDVLKRAGQWENTVIMCQGEFGRSPRDNSAVMGSDHGWEGAGSTIFSGKLSRPYILGNLTSVLNGTYKGTWQGSTTNLVDGGRYPLRVEHVASTVANMLGVKTPTPNAQPLWLNGQALVEDSKIE